MMRRKFLIMLAALLMVAVVGGCKKDSGNKLSEQIIGSWELSAVDFTRSVMIGDVFVEVYVDFLSDGSFTLSQVLGAGRAEEFSGTWTLTGSTLSGTYSDGTAWGTDYEASVTDDVLTLVSGGDTYRYTRR